MASGISQGFRVPQPFFRVDQSAKSSTKLKQNFNLLAQKSQNENRVESAMARSLENIKVQPATSCSKKSAPSNQNNHFEKSKPTRLPLFKPPQKKKSDARIIPFNKKISQAVRDGDIDEALRVFDSIPQYYELDDYTFNPLLNFYAKKKDINGMENVYEKMVKA